MIWKWIRNRVRKAVFALARRFAESEDGSEILARSLSRVQGGRPCLPAGLAIQPFPYPNLGAAPLPIATQGEGAVIITGRFRSGSTLLWNLFRNMTGFTAYYEPYNERRWFDPATRGQQIDATHRHVSDYWAEYEGLRELGRYYREEWTRRNLFMDEGSWDADLLAYTRLLIERARGRAVLQCNRIDFRLPWFRRYFPRAVLVHIYRHPRDQWCSALRDPHCFPPDGTLADFPPHDRFYLLGWARDLAHHFPFLDERTVKHPYPLFYFLWKLSYLFGQRWCHHSLSMEELVGDPAGQLLRLFALLDIDPAGQDLGKLQALVARPELGKWREYAAEDWFRGYEASCEAVLADFFGTSAAQATASGASAGQECPAYVSPLPEVRSPGACQQLFALGR